MSKDKKFQSKTQVFDTLGKLVQPIENFEENKNKICEEFLLVLIESSFHVEKEEENEILSKDS